MVYNKRGEGEKKRGQVRRKTKRETVKEMNI